MSDYDYIKPILLRASDLIGTTKTFEFFNNKYTIQKLKKIRNPFVTAILDHIQNISDKKQLSEFILCHHELILLILEIRDFHRYSFEKYFFAFGRLLRKESKFAVKLLSDRLLSQKMFNCITIKKVIDLDNRIIFFENYSNNYLSLFNKNMRSFFYHKEIKHHPKVRDLLYNFFNLYQYTYKHSPSLLSNLHKLYLKTFENHNREDCTSEVHLHQAASSSDPIPTSKFVTCKGIHDSKSSMWRCIGKEINNEEVETVWVYVLKNKFNNLEHCPSRKKVLTQIKVDQAYFRQFPAVQQDPFTMLPFIRDNKYYQFLGYRFHYDKFRVYTFIPTTSYFNIQWQKLVDTKNVPKLILISTEGVASNKDFIEHNLQGKIVCSEGEERVHDHFTHIISEIDIRLGAKRQDFDKIQGSYIQRFENEYCAVLHYETVIPDDNHNEKTLIKILKLSIGIFIDLFTSEHSLAKREKIIQNWIIGYELKDYWAPDSQWREAFADEVEEFESDVIIQFRKKVLDTYKMYLARYFLEVGSLI